MPSNARSESNGPLPDWPPATATDFIVSFPKSGRTWLRVLLAAACALQRRQEIHSLVGQWLDSDLLALDDRSIMLTHALANRMEHGDADLRAFAEHIRPARRILLLRDPRDTVVSYFFQRTRRPRKDTPEAVPQTIGEFVRHPALGIDRIIQFLNLWIREIGEGGPGMTLAYEDLHSHTPMILHNVLQFLGIRLDDAASLDQAIEFAAFSNMRKMEAGQHFVHSKKLRAYDPADPATYKTREGRVGSYRGHVELSDIDYIESRIRELLDPEVGYQMPGVPSAQVGLQRSGIDAGAPELEVVVRHTAGPVPSDRRQHE